MKEVYENSLFRDFFFCVNLISNYFLNIFSKDFNDIKIYT